MSRRYQFRLESIRRLRQEHRDAMRQRLGEAIHAAQLLEQHRGETEREIEGLKTARRQALQVPSPDVNRLLDFQRYELLVQAQLQALAQQQKTLSEEVERRRSVLAEAEQQVRVLDKLDERRRQEHHQEELRQEELVLNEVATQMYLRKREHAGN